MTATTVGVVKERAPGERRVALVPDSVKRVRSAGMEVLVETGAGARAWFPDEAYVAAGAAVVSARELYERSGVLLCVGPPEEHAGWSTRPGQVLLGMLDAQRHPGLVGRWAERGVTAVSLDLIPRTLSRAQGMDALTSQANVAGYRAAVLAAATYGGYFPMLMTAAGTVKPATVLVLGAGVAGLQAIGTARRLGAVVTAYDVRPESKAEAESLGAHFLDLAGPGGTAVSGSGTGGYARELTAGEREAQQGQLNQRIARFDVVITTAQVPGSRPPVLVTAQALDRMRPGSVVVDLAASALGGNVEGSVPDRTVVLGTGVTVIGAGNLPSGMAPAASTAYARNVTSLLEHLAPAGVPVIDLADEIQASIVVTHAGSVVNPAVAALVRGEALSGGVL
ncbi:NAD(P) transhydrogenase subunit alpha [Flindersiella endophytica]